MTTKIRYRGVGTFANFGFTLEHPDDHVLELRHEGETVARFSQLRATEQSIQSECALHLVKKHGWDDALWQPTK